MKIILFSSLYPNISFPTYGIFNLSRAKALKNYGYDVIVIAPISLNPHFEYFFPKLKIKELIRFYRNLLRVPKIEFNSGIKIYHPRWIKPPNKFFANFHVIVLHLFIGRIVQKIINDYQPELIISTWLNPFSVYSKYIPKKLKISYFAIAEGSDILIDSTRFNGWQKMERIINKNCDIVIAVSNMMKIQMQRKTKLQKIKIIKNGYDGETFYFKETNRFIDNHIIKIIHVGGFYSVKGQDVLLKSLLILDLPIKLTLIGIGPELGQCRQFVQDNRLQKKVNFLGQVSHNKIADLIRENDIFCMPSRSEGLPAAPLEAMACGLPVVGTNVGGMNEIIIDGFNGFLCLPESPEDIIKKIDLASKYNWNRIGISDWVKSHYSWNAWAKSIIEEQNVISKQYINC